MVHRAMVCCLDFESCFPFETETRVLDDTGYGYAFVEFDSVTSVASAVKGLVSIRASSLSHPLILLYRTPCSSTIAA